MRDGAFLALLSATGAARAALGSMKAAFRAAHPEFADLGDFNTRVLESLRRLEAGGFVSLPQGKAAWDRAVTPALPKSVGIVRQRASPATRPAIAWVPELAFGADCQPATRAVLEPINIWLAVVRNRHRPIVPAAERSLEIFGDEKRLAELCQETPGGEPTMFGGRLKVSALRARRVEPPLSHVLGRDGSPVLVLENLASYDTFVRWNAAAAMPFGAVAWGAGGMIGQSWAHLRDMTAAVGTGTVLYLGDLDAPGLAILGRTAAMAAGDGSFRLIPHAEFYRYLAFRGRRVLRAAAPATLATAIGVLDGLFPEDIRMEVTELLSSGHAVPQESLGIEALTDGSAWMPEPREERLPWPGPSCGRETSGAAAPCHLPGIPSGLANSATSHPHAIRT